MEIKEDYCMWSVLNILDILFFFVCFLLDYFLRAIFAELQLFIIF